MNLRRVWFPLDHRISTFTVMDTSEDQVFMFLENHARGSVLGNLYISDERGRYFSLSIENVIKGSAVDFEKVESLDGTFIANVYESKENRHEQGYASKQKKEVGDADDFDESDMIAQEDAKASKSRMSTQRGMNKKQKETMKALP